MSALTRRFSHILRAVVDITCLISVVTTLTDSGDVTDDTLDRERRALVFQSGAVMQLTFGVTSPVDIPNKTVALSVCLQANFALPTNATQLDYFYVQQQRRDVGGLHLGEAYEHLEAELGERGLHGEQCLLRSICQAAAAPLDRGRGVLEELLHLVLTPSEDDDAPEELRVHERYLEAERRGRWLGDCDAAFPACPVSPLDLLTVLG